MSVGRAPRGGAEGPADGGRASAPRALDHRPVDPVMLLSDLVYVFLITEVSGVLRGEPGMLGVARAGVILALVYWQWVLVSVQTSLRDMSTAPNRFTVMLLMLVAMVSAAAVPEAFNDRATVLAVSCTASRFLITGLLARSENSRAFRMDLLASLIQAPLLIAGAIVGGTAQLVLWAGAALYEISGPLIHSRTMRAQRYDVGNVVERFGLLIIVALGETIVSICTPQAELSELTTADLAVLVAAFVLVVGLWWAYFHRGAALMEHYIANAAVPFLPVRNQLAYGHLVLVAGLIAIAAGFHHVVADPHHPADARSAALLCAGTISFLGMFAVVRLRNIHRVYVSRMVASGICLLLIPVGMRVSGLVLVSALAAVAAAQCAWETLAPRSAGVPERDELAAVAAIRG